MGKKKMWIKEMVEKIEKKANNIKTLLNNWSKKLL